MNNEYNLIEEYKKHGEDFNLTGSEKQAIYIKDCSDDFLKKQYDSCLNEPKLHWREQWMFIFKDAYQKRRKLKLHKICLSQEK